MVEEGEFKKRIKISFKQYSGTLDCFIEDLYLYKSITETIEKAKKEFYEALKDDRRYGDYYSLINTLIKWFGHERH
jgi:hypothetical protein